MNPDVEAQLFACNTFNAAVRIGTEVNYLNDSGEWEPRVTCTRALIGSGGIARVLFSGFQGSFDLNRVSIPTHLLELGQRVQNRATEYLLAVMNDDRETVAIIVAEALENPELHGVIQDMDESGFTDHMAGRLVPGLRVQIAKEFYTEYGWSVKGGAH